MKSVKKIILITGASSGIGFETARGLIEEGHVVYCAARDVAKMRRLELIGGRIIQLDVTDDESLINFVKDIVQNETRIDVLINNAGFAAYSPVENFDLADARRQLEINLIAPARLMQLVIPHMRDQHAGKIINISSLAGKLAIPFGGWYSASKFGLEGLSDAVRNEVSDFGIDVVIIEPGGVKTKMNSIAMENLLRNSANTIYNEKAIRLASLNRDKYANPITVYKLISDIIKAKSPKSRYITGYLGKLMVFLKHTLSDRSMDHILKKRIA